MSLNILSRKDAFKSSIFSPDNVIKIPYCTFTQKSRLSIKSSRSNRKHHCFWHLVLPENNLRPTSGQLFLTSSNFAPLSA